MMGSNVSDTKLKPATKKPATRKPAPHAPELTKDDVYLFGIGTWERSWEKMARTPTRRTVRAAGVFAFGRPT